MPNLTRKTIAAGLLSAGLVGGVVGAEIDDAFERRAETNAAAAAEPDCDVTAQSGDTLEGIHRRLGQAGDGGEGEDVLMADGTVRTPENSSRYFIAGSKGLEAGDTVRVKQVGANVCQAVGGEVVAGPQVPGGATTQATGEADQ